MKLSVIFIILLQFLFIITTKIRKVPIAVILPTNDSKWFSIHRVKPAIDIALKRTGAYLDRHRTELTVKYADSKCHISEAINEAINFYMNGQANVFFGPCCDYAAAPIARQIRYWNLPMLTAGAMAGDFGVLKKSTYHMMTRVGPDINSLARFVFSYMDYYKWHKVKLLFEPFGQESVFERFCHLAADGIHRAILNRQKAGYNIEQDYFKFEHPQEIIERLATEVGNTFSGESFIIDLFFPRGCLLFDIVRGVQRFPFHLCERKCS